MATALSEEIEDLLYLKLDRVGYAGYKTEFLLNRFDNEMCCVSCLGLAQMPTRITTCNHIACKSCLDNILSSNLSICPADNREFTGKHIQGDANMAKRIGEIGVCCPLQGRGCVWEGKLKLCYTHLLSCTSRPTITKIRCEHCNEMFNSIELARQHKDMCPALKIPCPNQCESDVIARSLIPQHLKECPNSAIHCPLQNIGCDFMCMRSAIGQHMSNEIVRHTTLIGIALNSLMKNNETSNTGYNTQVNERIARLEVMVAVRDKDISFLKTQYRVLSDKLIEYENTPIPDYTYNPFCWVVNDIQTKRANNCEVMSPCVYSAPGGYALVFKLVINGLGMGRGTHLSVITYQCKGVFDSKLKWPVKFKFTFSVLNQSQDKDHIQFMKLFNFSSPVLASNTTSLEHLVIPDLVSYRDMMKASGELLHYILDDKISIRILIQSCE
ncbi:TNF receptor-associated factor 4 [Oopsacas minuta]|uniref:TNF receptor-associated factor 4 n=1 Tax=Oopsacas minuta TaxID=111878 RepID=A0AAV7JBM2_9METZ|nr:TNF receptor-associated factor 4 [Oopsacas minuta]